MPFLVSVDLHIVDGLTRGKYPISSFTNHLVITNTRLPRVDKPANRYFLLYEPSKIIIH